MESYNPAQPNAPPVEEMSDEELLALRERCSRELAMRAVSEQQNQGSKGRVIIFSSGEKRAFKKVAKNVRNKKPISTGFRVVTSPEVAPPTYDTRAN